MVNFKFVLILMFVFVPLIGDFAQEGFISNRLIVNRVIPRIIIPPALPAKPIKYNRKDVLTIAEIIWKEARGESFMGKYAVASVIYNRANGNSEDFVSIVKSDDWLGEPYDKTVIKGDYTYELRIALAMYQGKFKPIDNWNYFYNPKLASPEWRKHLKNTKKIGRHRFGTIS